MFSNLTVVSVMIRRVWEALGLESIVSHQEIDGFLRYVMIYFIINSIVSGVFVSFFEYLCLSRESLLMTESVLRKRPIIESDHDVETIPVFLFPIIVLSQLSFSFLCYLKVYICHIRFSHLTNVWSITTILFNYTVIRRST